MDEEFFGGDAAVQERAQQQADAPQEAPVVIAAPPPEQFQGGDRSPSPPSTSPTTDNAPLEMPKTDEAEVKKQSKVISDRTSAIDQASTKNLEENKAKAKAYITKLVSESEKETATRKQKNHESQVTSLQERDKLMAHGQLWDRVVAMVDLSNTHAGGKVTAKDGGKAKAAPRVDRMHQIFAAMRNETKK
jgi:hypothetical protein